MGAVIDKSVSHLQIFINTIGSESAELQWGLMNINESPTVLVTIQRNAEG